MATAHRTETSPITLSCFVASTPWAGGWRLGQLLGQSDRTDAPRSWFDPLRVPYRSHMLSIQLGAADWAARYLEAVRAAATREGICWVSLQWNHLRWLAQIARVALQTSTADCSTLDTDVLAAWFPNPWFVRVGSADTASQALRWYAALHPGRSEPEYQEVRWLEAIIQRQDRAWTTFFRVHGIEPLLVQYDEIVSQPAETVGALLGAIGIATDRQATDRSLVDGPSEQQAARWRARYRTVRPGLRTTVGARSSRP
jgi:LPS sulfotransferase NodH